MKTQVEVELPDHPEYCTLGGASSGCSFINPDLFCPIFKEEIIKPDYEEHIIKCNGCKEHYKKAKEESTKSNTTDNSAFEC